ncbi:hypothetical protein Trydic_g5805 [Trypoxylus dichotomus]
MLDGNVNFTLDIIQNLRIEAIATLPIREATKERIQRRFLTELGIKVDFVKQGHGSTNTKDTSRTSFRNPSLAVSRPE